MRAARVRVPHRPRHHIGLMIAVPLAISGLLVLMVAAPSWAGWPTATNTLALMPFVFGAPLLAAVQAYESARLEESSLATWVPRIVHVKLRENVRCLAGSWIATAVCAIAWYATARIVTGMNPHGHARASLRPVLGYLALAVLATAIGHLVGKLQAHMAIAVATAFVIVLAVSIYVTQYANTDPALVIPALPVVVLSVGAAVSTAVALLAPLGSPRGFASVGVAAAVAACAITTASLSHDVVLRSDADEVCMGENESTTICVWREHEAALEPLIQISQKVQAVAPQAMNLPARINEFGLDGTVNVSISLNLNNAAVLSRGALAAEYVLALNNHVFSGYDNSASGAAARSALEALFVVAAYPSITDGQVAIAYLDPAHLDEARQVLSAGAPQVAAYAAALFETATNDLQ